MQTQHTSHSNEQTMDIAKDLAAHLRAGDRVALYGLLGAGKTCFAKGVVSALAKINHLEITSPTFTIVEEYTGAVPIFHVDLYRLENKNELEDLPWDDLLSPEAITLMEWPEKAKIHLDLDFSYEVHIEAENFQTRKITIKKTL